MEFLDPENVFHRERLMILCGEFFGHEVQEMYCNVTAVVQLELCSLLSALLVPIRVLTYSHSQPTCAPVSDKLGRTIWLIMECV